MRGILFVLMAVVVFLQPQTPYAADKPETSGPKIQQFQEVERGFWIRSAFGMSMAFTNVFDSSAQESSVWPPGFMAGIEIGVDLGQVASIHAAVYGQQISGMKSIGNQSISNDGSGILFMGGARFSLMTTKRLAWFIKASAGYMVAGPDVVALDNGLALQAGTGLEYATNLRHFSVGLELSGQYLLAASSFGVLVNPTLKYAF